MSNIIQYGKKLKKTAPFFGDSSIIQQFSLQGNNILQKISIYIELNDKCNHDYYSKIIIVDNYFVDETVDPWQLISVFDGDTSTNDMLSVIANGMAESRVTVMTLIKQSGCIVTILGGRLIFKEKGTAYKMFCAAVIVIGIVIGVMG